MGIQDSSLLNIINNIDPIHINIYKIFDLLLIIVFTWLFYHYYIHPNALRRYYIKQGFTPSNQLNLLIGNKVKQKEDDSMEYFRDIVNKIPDIKGLVFKLGSKVIIAIIDPKMLREISQSPYLVKYSTHFGKRFNRKSLVRMEGEKHKRTRRILNSVFHFDYVISNIEVTTQISLEKFKEWEDKHWIDNEFIDIVEESGNFTGEVIGALFFGISQNANKIKGRRISDFIENLLLRIRIKSNESMRKPWISIMFELGLTKELRELKQDMYDLENYAREILKKKRAHIQQLQKDTIAESIVSRDLTSALLKAQTTAKSFEEKLTDDEIIAQYILFFIAGQDTTSHLITICVYLLTQYPQYANSIREEIRNNIPDLNHITYQQISNLNLLNGFIKEALRLYPPVTQIVTRIATNDFIIDEKYHIKKGTLISAFLLANSWKKDNFNEPKQFKPERWISEGNKLKDPFVYLPFWAGPRNCIGQHLATLETKIFLIQALAIYNIELDPSYQLKMTNRFMYEPLDHVKVRFSKFKLN